MSPNEYAIESAYHKERIALESISKSDIIRNEDGKSYHVINDNQSLNARIIDVQNDGKSLRVSINGNSYDIIIKDHLDELIDSMGLNAMNDQKLSNVSAPMPGLVVDVMVSAGDTLTTGSPILILEAMKMENVLRASGDGVVKSVSVSKGETVDKGQILIEVE